MVERRDSISVIGAGLPADRPSHWVAAYGEADDHLRITALLANALGGGPDSPCLNPKSPWVARRDALRELLTAHQAGESGWVAGVVDPDLLFKKELSPRDAWDDPTFAKERTDLFRLLSQAAQHGGWLFWRSTLRPGASLELEGLSEQVELATDGTATSPRYADALATLTPGVRPICRSLVDRGLLTPARAAATIAAAAPSPEAALIAAAYDQLPRSAREVARQVSCVRPRQLVNGVLGPYALVDQPAGAGQLRRAAVEALREAAFLQPGPEPHTLRMPVEVRLFLQTRARWPGAGAVEEHLWLARRLSAGTPSAEQVVEAHHHAIAAADEELAFATTRFYGADLRELAYRLSLARKYEEAARLYERIVNEYDDTDAYAWEYLAYNLQRAGDTTATDAQELRIEAAYVRASQLAPTNPLYRGRLLGYRARLGREVAPEVQQALRTWARDATALSFFGKPVLDGLRAGGKRSLATELRKRWPAMASYHPPAGE